MADEPNSNTTPTAPQSSEQGSPSPAAVSGSDVASPQNPTPLERPAALADSSFDSYWDDAAGLKVDDVARDMSALRAEKAQWDLRTATVPENPDAYNVTIPDTLDWPKLPDGTQVKVEIDPKDPALAEFRKVAHEMKLPQEEFTRTLGLYARVRAGEDAMIATARTAEVQKLGANASARVDAVSTWLKAKLGDKGQPLLDRMVLSTDFEALEDLMRSANVVPLTQKGREQPSPAPQPAAKRLYPNMN